jgi:GNAT superfamily N-acetyltransferase
VTELTTPPGLVVRDARADDLPSVVALLADDVLGRNREQLADPLPQGYLDAFAAIEADPAHRLVVVELDGVVVGTLQLSFLPSLSLVGAERAQVEGVHVAAAHRGRGIGAHLVAWATDQAERHGSRVLQLTSNVQRTDAHRFYERLGFVASHVGMKLTLPRDG